MHDQKGADEEGTQQQQHSQQRTGSESPQSLSGTQSVNPQMSTMTAMSGMTMTNHDPISMQNMNVAEHNRSNASIAATAGDTLTCNSNPMTHHSNGHATHNRLMLDNMPPFDSSRASSMCNTAAATVGSPTATLRSNPPAVRRDRDRDRDRRLTAASHSVDSRMSHSASVSAVATAGGLTVTSAPAAHSHNNSVNGKSLSRSPRPPSSENGEHHAMSAHAHAPPPLLPDGYRRLSMQMAMQNTRAQSTQSTQESRPNSSNSIETQIGSMPPQMPSEHLTHLNGREGLEGSPSSNRSRSGSSKPPTLQPLHERRRLMDNAPTTLSIPSSVAANQPRPAPFGAMAQ